MSSNATGRLERRHLRCLIIPNAKQHLCAVGVASLCLLLSRAAHATEAATEATVFLSITACDEARVPADRLLELTSAEVAGSGVTIAIEPTPASVRGVVELCHGSPERVWMALEVGAQRVQERSIDLSDIDGELRTRTVAVAFAELLTTWRASISRSAELAALTPGGDSSAKTRSAEPKANVAARTAPAARERSPAGSPRQTFETSSPPMRFGSGVAVREFVTPTTILAGPWLAIGSRFWQAEALYLQVSKTVPLGTVSLHNLNLAASFVGWQFGSALSVLIRLRGELGVSWAVGSARPGGRAVGSTRAQGQLAFGPEWQLAVPLSRVVRMHTRLGVGVAYGPTATAGKTAVAASGGPFVGVAIGLEVGRQD